MHKSFAWMREHKALAVVMLAVALSGSWLGYASATFISDGYNSEGLNILARVSGTVFGFASFLMLMFIMPYRKRPSLGRYVQISLITWFIAIMGLATVLAVAIGSQGLERTIIMGEKVGLGFAILVGLFAAFVAGFIGIFFGLILVLLLSRMRLMPLEGGGK